MAARLVVVSGPGLGLEHWIENPVTRIGSDPACGLCLEGIEPQTATLEFRNDGYRLHARSPGLDIEGRSLPVGQSADWPAGTLLGLPDGSTLLLEDRGGLAPQRRSGVQGLVPAELAEKAPIVGKMLGSTATHQRIRLALISALLVATALLIWSRPHNRTRVGPDPELELLFRPLASTSRTADGDRMRIVAEELQAAHLARLCHRLDTARIHQRRAQMHILRARQSTDAKLDAWYDHALSYIAKYP